MAKAFTYKKTTTTNLKLCGFIDTDNMVFDLDGVEKSLSTLLQDFNGAVVELSIKVKSEEDLSEPEEDIDADELAADED